MDLKSATLRARQSRNPNLSASLVVYRSRGVVTCLQDLLRRDLCTFTSPELNAGPPNALINKNVPQELRPLELYTASIDSSKQRVITYKFSIQIRISFDMRERQY